MTYLFDDAGDDRGDFNFGCQGGEDALAGLSYAERQIQKAQESGPPQRIAALDEKPNGLRECVKCGSIFVAAKPHYRYCYRCFRDIATSELEDSR